MKSIKKELREYQKLLRNRGKEDEKEEKKKDEV